MLLDLIKHCTAYINDLQLLLIQHWNFMFKMDIFHLPGEDLVPKPTDEAQEAFAKAK